MRPHNHGEAWTTDIGRVTLACLALLVLAAAQDDWAAWLDKEAAGFSGVVLIARGDTIQHVSAHGFSDRAAQRRNTPEMRFNLGSIHKTFTAVAVAQLLQQRRLSLDDALAKHIADYPDAQAAAKITLRQLLTHRAGVATFMGGDFGDAVTVAEMTRRVGAQPLEFEPGERQQYSNGGYVLLGRVVELVSGRSYDSYVAERIFKPAGMTSSGFARVGETDPTFAVGYDSNGAARAARPGNPAGGGYATATDLFRFARALRDGRLLDESLQVGFALREQTAGTHRFVGNGGGAPGVNAEFRYEPAGDATVVVLANGSPPAATRLLNAVLERLGALSK